MQMLAALPVTIIGGYLGAGKTTLVNHLLRNAGGRRLAVLVNDFGELPIDADLIEHNDGNVIGIAGGCVCCSYGSDLIAALEDLQAWSPRPDQVLIETSGVGLPAAVASAVSLVRGYRTEGIVVLADAETIRRRALDPYMADTVMRQLSQADLLVLNKTDLVDLQALTEIRRWLTETAPTTPLLETRDALVPPTVVLGLDAMAVDPGRRPAARPGAAGQQIHDTSDYATASFQLDDPVDARALALGLAASAAGLLRAKGIVNDHSGVMLQIQVVGARWQVHAAGTAGSGPGRLVIIGLRAAIQPGAVEALIAQAAQRQTAAAGI